MLLVTILLRHIRYTYTVWLNSSYKVWPITLDGATDRVFTTQGDN